MVVRYIRMCRYAKVLKVSDFFTYPHPKPPAPKPTHLPLVEDGVFSLPMWLVEGTSDRPWWGALVTSRVTRLGGVGFWTVGCGVGFLGRNWQVHLTIACWTLKAHIHSCDWEVVCVSHLYTVMFPTCPVITAVNKIPTWFCFPNPNLGKRYPLVNDGNGISHMFQ